MYKSYVYIVYVYVNILYTYIDVHSIYMYVYPHSLHIDSFLKTDTETLPFCMGNVTPHPEIRPYDQGLLPLIRLAIQHCLRWVGYEGGLAYQPRN